MIDHFSPRLHEIVLIVSQVAILMLDGRFGRLILDTYLLELFLVHSLY